MNKIFAFSLLAISLTAISSNAQEIKHRPLIEEYTGLWCQWCPRGHVAMEMIEEQYGDDQVSISYHVDDAMAVATRFPISVTGVPVATVDREKKIDPYYGETEREDFAISRNIDAAMAKPAEASIEVSAIITGSKVQAYTKVEFAEDADGKNYQIGYVLTCSGLTHTSWRQMNEYSSYRDKETFKGTPLEPLTQESVYIRGMVFDNVAVDASGTLGVLNSLPAKIDAGEEYEHSYSFNIAGNSLVQDQMRLKVVAFIIDKQTGEIVNANKYSFYKEPDQEEETAVDAVMADKEPVSKEYFDLTGTPVTHPSGGIYICRTTFADGTVKTTKEAR